MAQEGDNDTKMIYISRINLLKQIQQQGYNVSNFESYSYEQVNTMYKNGQLDMSIKHNETDKKILVKYVISKLIKQSMIEDMVDVLVNEEKILGPDDTIIIVARDPPNDTVQSVIKKIWSNENVMIVIRGIKTLQFNILEHEMVPPHETLTIDELKAFKKQFNIRNNEMVPEISRFDPVAQAIMIRPGEVCKITRSSKTAITSDFYRMCVNI